MKPHHPFRRWAVAGAAVAALGAGCASGPDPAPALAAGAASLEAARAAGAADYAAAPLEAARAKLERARLLARSGRSGDNEQALRLAQQADLDAQLARALAGAERSQRAVGEVDASLRTLRRETERPAPSPTPPSPTPSR